MGASRTRRPWRISEVASRYGVHPQTLRLYEREGLLRPGRSRGNTRTYTEEDLERLELILTLSRDLGVNLAGIEVVLHLRERIEALHDQIEALRRLLAEEGGRAGAAGALVRMSPAVPARARGRG